MEVHKHVLIEGYYLLVGEGRRYGLHATRYEFYTQLPAFGAFLRSYFVITHRYKTQGTKIEGAKNTKTQPILMSTRSESQAATMRAGGEKREHILALDCVSTNTSRKQQLIYPKKIVDTLPRTL